MGVYQRHPDPSRAEPGPDEVGGPPGRRLQVPEVRSCCSALGAEEEEQQHDVREAQQSHEVKDAILGSRDLGVFVTLEPGMEE